MPDDFGPPVARGAPCVPRYSDPTASKPAVVTRFLDGTASPSPPDELEQARQARDLLNRLVEEKKITISFDAGTGALMLIEAPLVVCRLVPRTEFDEVLLP